MATIAIYNSKGGVGKTVTAANLAVLLAREKSTLAIDTDAQFSLTTLLLTEVRPGANTYELLIEGLPLASCVTEAGRVRFPHLHVAPADARLVKADRALEGEPGSDLRLRRALRGLAEIEATLIDVPSGWGSVACNALCAATHLIIPINCDRFAYDCACDTLARLHQAREAYDLELPDVGVLLTAFDNSINAREIAALCEDTWPDRVFNTRIRHTVKIKELSLDGLTVLGAPPAKTGSAREDYENLFREIERKWL